MKVLAAVLLAWLAVSYMDGIGSNPVPSVVPTGKALPQEDCHCLIEANHGLYR